MYHVSELAIPIMSMSAINDPPKYDGGANLPETAFTNNRHEVEIIDC